MEKPKYPDFSKEFQPSPLAEDYIQKRLEFELPKWRVIKSPLRENPLEEQVDLFRAFEFDSFKEVTEFISGMNNISEIIMHHPRIENMYTSLEVYLSTWGIGHRISIKDILFAKNLDAIYGEKYGERIPKEFQINQLFINSIKGLIVSKNLQEAIETLNEYFVLNKRLTIPNEIFLFRQRVKNNHSNLINGVIKLACLKGL